MKSNVIFCRFHNVRWMIAVLLVLWLIAGCGTVQQQPFAKFSLSLQELRKGADEALKYNDSANRTRFIKVQTSWLGQAPCAIDVATNHSRGLRNRALIDNFRQGERKFTGGSRRISRTTG